MTFKSDGKSSSEKENVSEKFTQRPTNEDTYYEEHDVTDTHDYKKNLIGPRVYFALGIVLAFGIFFAITTNRAEDIINYERDKTLAELQRRKLEGVPKSPFDDA